MNKFLSRKFLTPLLVFVLLDLFAVGVGMGVPIFAIGLGFVAGWFFPSILLNVSSNLRQLLRLCLTVACLTSVFTFLLMLIIWGPVALMLFDPSADIANFGIPMILYEPTASFIGWIVLMIVISPFLQVISSIFTSSVRLVWFPPALLQRPMHLALHES
jgi:hypothetical protein